MLLLILLPNPHPGSCYTLHGAARTTQTRDSYVLGDSSASA